jgi:hypothetical protein
MSLKIKMQATIREIYGWTKEKTYKTQNPSREEIHNNQLEQQLHGIFGSLSKDDVDKETNEAEEDDNNQQKLKVKTKIKLCMEWLDKFDWSNYVRNDDTITIKCIYCEKYRISGPWVLGNGCTTLQHNSFVIHEKSLVHKDVKANGLVI